MKKLKLLNKYSYLHSINGSLIEAELDDVSVGEVCEIYASWQANERIARAQVVGFRNGKTLLNLIGSSVGLTRTAVLKPTGEQLTIQISDAFLGSVLNASGQIMERFVPDTPGERGNLRLIDELPPSYQERRVINTPLETRIRVIDGVLTCGIGQRVGIFEFTFIFLLIMRLMSLPLSFILLSQYPTLCCNIIVLGFMESVGDNRV